MDENKSFMEAICRLTKKGYNICIRQDTDPTKCILMIEKNSVTWNRIVSYELLQNDNDSGAYIFDSLERSYEKHAEWNLDALRE